MLDSRRDITKLIRQSTRYWRTAGQEGARCKLTIGVNNGSGTFDGRISDSTRVGAGEGNGSIALLKLGSGTQTFSAVHSYMGSTTLDSGALVYTA